MLGGIRMTIKEITEKTGLSGSNIRFYEKKGLLNPNRKENQYRDYTDNDLKRLNQIKLLRILDLSIEEIKDCINETISLKEVLTNKLIALKEEQSILHRNELLCQLLLDKNCSFEEIDPDLPDVSIFNSSYPTDLKKIRKKDSRKYYIYKSYAYFGIFFFLCLLGFFTYDWLRMYYFTADYSVIGIMLFAFFFSLLTNYLVCSIKHNETKTKD